MVYVWKGGLNQGTKELSISAPRTSPPVLLFGASPAPWIIVLGYPVRRPFRTLVFTALAQKFFLPNASLATLCLLFHIYKNRLGR